MDQTIIQYLPGDVGGLFAGLAVAVLFFIIAMLAYEYFHPQTRYQNYLQSYRMGRLVKQAKEKNVDFVFEKKRKQYIWGVKEVDAEFENVDPKPNEFEEIDFSKNKVTGQ